MTKRKCSKRGCQKPNSARKLCTTHYQQWRRTQPPKELRQYNPVKGHSCTKCEQPAQARLLCVKHYKAQQRAQQKDTQ